MGKKVRTISGLEKNIRELQRELEFVKRKYKRALRDLSKYEDRINDPYDFLEEYTPQETPNTHKSRNTQEEQEQDFFEVVLPDGTIKKIKKLIIDD